MSKTNFHRIVYFKTLTSTHMGAGQGLEHIDLPVQREQHTKFPIFYASGIKGAFRQYALEKAYEELKNNEYTLSRLNEKVEKYKEDSNEPEQIRTLAKLFGSQDNKGSISYTDAKILFFPVKSLKGVFAYVTSSFVLKRYEEDTGIKIDTGLKLKEGSVYCSDNLVIEGSVILEEFEFKFKDIKDEVIKALKLPKALESEVLKRYCIVDDDTFAYFVENFTEVVTRIKINPETGTVGKGALWTEEYLPSECIFYSLEFREKDSDVYEKYLPKDSSLINLGGNQTIGKGLVKIFYGGKHEGN